MKIGTIKVKRNYLIAQMVIDALSVLLLLVIFECTLAFADEISEQNKLIVSSGNTSVLVAWQWNLIWLILGVLFTAFTLFLIYRKKELPKKYKINEKNAQKYNDIFITAVSCIRIPVLLAFFDMMYIHQMNMKFQSESLFSVQVLMDIVLIVIIIRFSIHRIHGIEAKEDEKKRDIIEG